MCHFGLLEIVLSKIFLIFHLLKVKLNILKTNSLQIQPNIILQIADEQKFDI